MPRNNSCLNSLGDFDVITGPPAPSRRILPVALASQPRPSEPAAPEAIPRPNAAPAAKEPAA